MRTQHLSLILAAATLIACGTSTEDVLLDEPMIPTATALPNVAMPPGGMPIGTEGSGEALQLLVSTPIGADTVAEFYRGVLSNPPYTLINDNTTGNSTTFYVEQDGPPLWVTVEGLSGGGSLVRLAGAAVRERPAGTTPDSAAAVPVGDTD